MSHWIEPTDQPGPQLADCVDVSFRIQCASLPVDHAEALSNAVLARVPWLAQATGAGVHTVHVAASQNGWDRPTNDTSETLILSRRTRLRIRTPIARAKELVDALSGQHLLVNNHTLHIQTGAIKTLQPARTLFSRYVVFDEQAATAADENQFVSQILHACTLLDHKATKVLCGKTNLIQYQGRSLITRSVLIEDVPDAVSLQLQTVGLGRHRSIGCGLVLQHKSTAAVSEG